jgi:hypothetical protein
VRKLIGLLLFGTTRITVLAGALALAACSILETRSDAEVIKERAEARWGFMIEGNIRKAYEFLSPGSREVVSADAYVLGIKPGMWRAVKVDKVNCAAPDACDVDLTINYVFAGKNIRTPLREKWVRQDAKWWYFYER